MDKVMEIIGWFSANLPLIIGVLSAIIALTAMIPGPEPERTLQKILDFLSKFSLGKDGRK